MTKNLQLLKITLVVYGVVGIIYGVLFLIVPQLLVNASGSEPVPSGWLRWSGGILVALGVGSFLALKNLTNQETLVLTFALVTLLCGLALLYSLIFENVTNAWFTIIPVVLNLLISVFFWLSWKKLTTKQEEES